MVKWTSCLASNEVFQVRVLVGVLHSPVVQRQDVPVTWGRSVVRVHPGLLSACGFAADAWCSWCNGLACDSVKVEAAGSIPPGHPDRPTGVCSWESRRSPKPSHRVQILALLLNCR